MEKKQTKTDIVEFYKQINKVRLGAGILKSIRKKHGKNITVCISPYPNLTDAYLAGLYLNSYYGRGNFVVTAISYDSMEVYHYLDIKNVHRLTREETDYLIQYCRFMGNNDDKIKILHHQPEQWHVGIANNFRGAHGLNYADLFETQVFPEVERSDRIYPVSSQGSIENYELVLKKGKSVVIFPYADSLPMPGPLYWIRLVRQLKKKGYVVATYVPGDEQAIEGSIGITCKLSGLVSLVEYAGFFVSVRNGLTDIMSHANCRKMILYPETGTVTEIHGTVREFWSLIGFGYTEDVEEYEWKKP